MTTFAPASASAVAMPRPMPDAAPVTIAVLPEISIMVRASVKVAAGVDRDCLAGHRVDAAHRDDHVGAVLLVGGLFQQRTGGGVLDLLGPEVGGRARTLQEPRR